VSSIVKSVTTMRCRHVQVDDTAKLSCNRLKRNCNKQESKPIRGGGWKPGHLPEACVIKRNRQGKEQNILIDWPD